MKQDKSEMFSEFSERTERLALKHGIVLSGLPAIIGISASMFHAYRSGKQQISEKVWRKLEKAEIESAIGDHLAKTLNQSENRTIPVLGWAHAGDAMNYDEIPESWQERVPTECRDPKAFAVRLEGDSMEPKFYEGDILILQPGEEIYNGCLAILKMCTDGYIFRRVEIRPECLRLIPLNPQWGVEEIPRDQIAWAYPVWGMVRRIAKR